MLVNNAGVAARLPVQELDARLIDWMYAVNVRAPLLMIAALAPAWCARTRRDHQRVLGISDRRNPTARSVRGYEGRDRRGDALSGDRARPAWDPRQRGGSGGVDTEMWARNRAIPGVIEEIEALTPLRRWSHPDDIAEVVAFLASDAARFLTGETVCVDGGMARTMALYGGPV